MAVWGDAGVTNVPGHWSALDWELWLLSRAMKEESATENGRHLEGAKVGIEVGTDEGFEVEVEFRGSRTGGQAFEGAADSEAMKAPAEEMKRCAQQTAEAVIGEIRRAFDAGKKDARTAVEESFDEVREKMRQGIHRAAYVASYAASFGSSLIKDLVAEDAREGASAGEGAAKGDCSTFRTKIEEAIRPKGEDAGEVKEEEAQDTGETDDSEIFGTGAS